MAAPGALTRRCLGLVMAMDFPWEDSRFAAPPTVHHLTVGDRSTLFCERRQQLLALNATADGIWRRLAAGKPASDLRREMADTGIGGEQARVFLRDATLQWMQAGLLTPSEVLRQVSSPPLATHRLKIGELRAELRFHGEVDPEAAGVLFDQFAQDIAPDLILSIVGAGGGVFLFEDERPAGLWRADEWVPQIKALLTERLTSAVVGDFLTHGALLERAGRGLFLSGDPGAGKTTLCLALAASGFSYQADDIVRIDQEGLATGAAFAPAVKSGSWALIEAYAPAIAAQPAWRRGDGQLVRYLPVKTAARRALPIGHLLLLSRTADAPARLEPLEPLDALLAVLGSAYSAAGRADAAPLKALAARLASASCFRFIYSDLDEAVTAIRTLVR